jgi:hypothetical protein
MFVSFNYFKFINSIYNLNNFIKNRFNNLFDLINYMMLYFYVKLLYNIFNSLFNDTNHIL